VVLSLKKAEQLYLYLLHASSNTSSFLWPCSWSVSVSNVFYFAYVITYSMGHDTIWKADSHLACQKCPAIFM
jgi:hypothetical protein